jgi:hypothetical protein
VHLSDTYLNVGIIHDQEISLSRLPKGDLLSKLANLINQGFPYSALETAFSVYKAAWAPFVIVSSREFAHCAIDSSSLGVNVVFPITSKYNI